MYYAPLSARRRLRLAHLWAYSASFARGYALRALPLRAIQYAIAFTTHVYRSRDL